jgi:hypothetical protein
LSGKESDESSTTISLGEERSTQVRLVDVFYPIRHDGIWNYQEIELDDKLPFLRGIIFRIPVPKGSPLTFGVHLEQVN